MEEHPSTPGCNPDPRGEGRDERSIQGEDTLLDQDFMLSLVQRHGKMLEGIELSDLQPDLFAEDRMLAEMIIVRDRLRGIEHPEMKGKLTAHW